MGPIEEGNFVEASKQRIASRNQISKEEQMKTVKLGACIVLVLAFVIGFCLPAQADNLDGYWYKGRLQGGQTRAFGTNLDGEVERFRLNGGDFYVKLCSNLIDDGEGNLIPEVSDCAGFEYNGFAVADFDDDGEFGELEEFSFIRIGSCGAAETGFIGFFDLENLNIEIGTDELIEAEFALLGKVKYDGNDVPRLRANSGNGSVAWSIDVLTQIGEVVEVTELILGRKGGIKLDVIDPADLPFDPASIPFLILFGDTRCVSELPEGTPVADAGNDQEVVLNGLVTQAGAATPAGGTFAWTFNSVPLLSALTDADIGGADTATATFTPDVIGEYILQLVYTVDTTASQPDFAVIDVAGAVAAD
jgi:hypothetical protein